MDDREEVKISKMKFLVASILSTAAVAKDNGLALTPPMGWRSWNLFAGDVNQDLMTSIMDGMVDRSRTVDGVPTSLCDLGYCDVGLDDNWQVCSDDNDYNFHDDDGNPIVNLDVFPDMKVMTDYAHSLGLTAGWYGNNCICAEDSTQDDMFYEGDVKAFMDFGFDGWKLDGCGAQLDLQLYDDLINATGKAVVVENCHWGSAPPFEPTLDWCPWNFFRTSGDVRASYSSVLENLATTYKYADTLLSRPGCWAYPDMLEVGCNRGATDSGGLNDVETRTHFGSWAIVSSPLTLSHDVNNATVMDDIWDLISNKEAIEINQVWFGHPGGPYKTSDEEIFLQHEEGVEGGVKVSAQQYLYKPMSEDGSKVAVLVLNSGDNQVTININFDEIPGFKGAERVDARCVWGRKDIGTFDEKLDDVVIESHDARFFMFEAKN
ncbi:hypothetical protein TL16_g03510 [Triparma laevis f. inornata]|uniref:Alpha-galactosidase n=1 Tax=Triparma laevis f. inornata TaxID=1714386 RepID=A0A9W7A1Y9_9STRA|nr:hypothetical protein TL16_g03510 [Triparma laevis f. inornata]